MNDITKRVIACVGILPAYEGVLFLVMMLSDSYLAGPSLVYALAVGYAVAAALGTLGWYLIWKRLVRWSRAVMIRTAIVAFICLFGPCALLIGLHQTGSGVDIALRLPYLGWGLWLALTMWLWPLKPFATATEATGPKCLKCGYSLRGLSTTRCPECGDEPTLDALWAGQA